jgi:hypothetical protein
MAHDADAAFAFASRIPMVRSMTHDLDESTRAEALDTLRHAIEAHQTDDGVVFRSAAWFITARHP